MSESRGRMIRCQQMMVMALLAATTGQRFDRVCPSGKLVPETQADEG